MLQPYQEQIAELVDAVEQKVKEFTASKSVIDNIEDCMISQVMLEVAQDCVEAMEKDVTGIRERFARTSQEAKETLQKQKPAVSGSGTVGAGHRSYRKSCYNGTIKSKETVPEWPRRESSTIALKAAANTGGLSYPHKWKRSNGPRY